MATLPTQSFTTMVSNTIAGIQGRSTKLVNFSIGSTLRAVVEGFAGLFLWFQALALQLLAVTRLSTSTGTDVDTFTADYMPVIAGSQTAALPNGSPRLPAQPSVGILTFARYTAGAGTPFVPVGTTVQTLDGSQSFQVVANTTYPAYSATPAPGGYTMAAFTSSVLVPAQAVVAGSAGNVSSNTITVLTTPVLGIDTVNNTAAFVNGFDFESDAALKLRFAQFIAALSKGTDAAIIYAIQATYINLQVAVHDNVDLSGVTDLGMVTVIIDDGSGLIPDATFLPAAAAAQLVRAASIRMGVYKATLQTVAVSMTLITATGYYHPTVIAQVSAAVTSYVNGVGLEQTVSYFKLAQIAFEASAGVTDIKNLTLNGGIADIVPSLGVTLKAGIITIA